MTLADGSQATMLATSRFLDPSETRLVRLPDGREVSVPKKLLELQDDGSYRINEPIVDPAALSSDTRVIPALAEVLSVAKSTVETGRVRIHKRVESTESVIDEPLLYEGYDVERVPVNRVLSEVPVPRQDGDTWILPVLEEVLVVEKRLVLREEIRLTRTRRDVRNPQKHIVRREHIEVERVSSPEEPTQ